MAKQCFNCRKETENSLQVYPICESCISKLKLFSDKTIKKHYLKNPEKFLKEIDRRLDFIEKDYIKKKIKLLHVKEQLKNL